GLTGTRDGPSIRRLHRKLCFISDARDKMLGCHKVIDREVLCADLFIDDLLHLFAGLLNGVVPAGVFTTVFGRSRGIEMIELVPQVRKFGTAQDKGPMQDAAVEVELLRGQAVSRAHLMQRLLVELDL